MAPRLLLRWYFADFFVLYYTAYNASGQPCVGYATASTPNGPFVDSRTTPLLCNTGAGGSRAMIPFILPGQIGVNPNTYLVWADSDGYVRGAIADVAGQPAAAPSTVLQADPGLAELGVIDDPAVVYDTASATYALTFTSNSRTSTNSFTNWATCAWSASNLSGCYRNPIRLLDATNAVRAPSSSVPFTDENGKQWLSYQAYAPAQCTTGFFGTCTGNARTRVDKVCFQLGIARSNGPTTTSQSTTRQSPCTLDVPLGAIGIADVTDAGFVHNPSNVVGRDGGASAKIGNNVLWTFDDTGFFSAASDGALFRPDTAALATTADPTSMSEPLDATGSPYQFLPFTADEIQYNVNNAPNRKALWPEAVIRLADGTGLVYYTRWIVPPAGLGYTFDGQGIAHVAIGATTGTRNATQLTDPSSTRMIGRGAFLASDGYIYSYGNDVGSSQTPGLIAARVLAGSVDDPAAYRYWNGSSWAATTSASATFMSGITVTPSDLSVFYNTYLAKYVMVYTAGTDSTVRLLTATSPRGPWSAPTLAFSAATPLPGALNSFDYAGKEHVEYQTQNGKSLLISVFVPNAQYGIMRLYRLTFV